MTIGDVIEVKDPTGATLPLETRCVVTDADGNQVQEITFSTGEGARLFLKDTYGILELESCQVGNNILDCVIPIEYSYNVTNDGESDATINSLQRMRGGATDELVGQLTDTDLMSDEFTVAREVEMIDICLDGSYTTDVTVSADPPRGDTCVDAAEFGFQIQAGCRVDVDIVSCQSAVGTDCRELTSRDDDCSVTLTYTYEIHNIGTKDMEVTSFTQTFQNEITILFDQVPDTDLSSGESTTLIGTADIDLCEIRMNRADAVVQAETTGGLTCEATDSFSISIRPPDVCVIDVSWNMKPPELLFECLLLTSAIGFSFMCLLGWYYMRCP